MVAFVWLSPHASAVKSKGHSRRNAALLCVAFLMLMPAVASAEPGGTPQTEKAQQQKNGKAGPARDSSKPPAVKPAVPDAENILTLIRSSLLTLNDAVLTGNFTVFLDKLAPSARDKLTAGMLYEAFKTLTKSGVNMTGLAVLTPELTDAPSLDNEGRLNLRGQFKYQNIVLKFALLFEATNSKWLLYGISAEVQEEPKPAAVSPGLDPKTSK